MSEDTTRAPCSAIQRDNPPFRLPSSSAEHVEKFWVVCARQKSNATDQLRTSHSMKSAMHAGVRIRPARRCCYAQTVEYARESRILESTRYTILAACV